MSRIKFIALLFIWIFLASTPDARLAAQEAEPVWSSHIRIDDAAKTASPKIAVTGADQTWVLWHRHESDTSLTLMVRPIPIVNSTAVKLAGPYPALLMSDLVPLEKGHLMAAWQPNPVSIISQAYNSTLKLWQPAFTFTGDFGDSLLFPRLYSDIIGDAWLFYFKQQSPDWVLIARRYVDTDGDDLPDQIARISQTVAVLDSPPSAAPDILAYQKEIWVCWIDKKATKTRVLIAARESLEWSKPVEIAESAGEISSLTLTLALKEQANPQIWLAWCDQSDASHSAIRVSSCENRQPDTSCWQPPVTIESTASINRQPFFLADPWGIVWLAWVAKKSEQSGSFNDNVMLGYFKRNQWRPVQTTGWTANPDDDFEPVMAHDRGENLWISWTLDANVYVLSNNLPPEPPASGFSPENQQQINTQAPVLRCNFILGPPDLQRFRFLLQENNTVRTFESGYGSNAVSVSLRDNQRYKYWIHTIDSAGLVSARTDSFTFYVNQNEEPPFLGGTFAIEGLEGGTVRTLTPRFTWEPARDADPLDTPNAISFELQIDHSNNFDTAALRHEIIGPGRTTYTVSSSLQEDTHYYARLRAVDRTQQVSNWSQTLAFFVNQRNTSPRVILTKPHGGEVFSGAMTIEWEAVDDDQDTLAITIQLSLDAGSSWRTLPATDDLGNAIHDQKINYQYFVDLERFPDSHQALVQIIVQSTNQPVTQRSGMFIISNARFNCLPRSFSPGDRENDKIIISFELRKSANVSVRIYNLAGQLKRVILERAYRYEGAHREEWNGRDDQGVFVPPRAYICVISLDDGKNTEHHRIRVVVTPD